MNEQEDTEMPCEKRIQHIVWKRQTGRTALQKEECHE